MRQVLIAYSVVRLQFYYRNHHFKSIGPGFFGLRRDGRGGGGGRRNNVSLSITLETLIRAVECARNCFFKLTSSKYSPVISSSLASSNV